MGLHLHSTLAINSDGLPLVVLRAERQAREAKAEKDKRPIATIPIQEKETYTWTLGLRDCMNVSREMPHTQVVSVMDREADFFELFDKHRKNPSVDLLVRAKHNRSTTGDCKLFDTVKQSPVRGRLSIMVNRKSARPKKSKGVVG